MLTGRYEHVVWTVSLALTGWYAWGELNAQTAPALAAGLAILLSAAGWHGRQINRAPRVGHRISQASRQHRMRHGSTIVRAAQVGGRLPQD